jgi:hypothetical protein
LLGSSTESELFPFFHGSSFGELDGV